MTGPSGVSWQLRSAVAAAVRAGGGKAEMAQRLGDVCAAAARVDGVSLSLMIDSQRQETLYASDAVARQIEQVQFTLGEGPCFEAFHTGRPVLVPDLAASPAAAWPVFAATIDADSVHALFAFPIALGVIRVGAMDLYRRTPGALTAPELAAALHVADATALVLLDPPTAATDGQLAPDWDDSARASRHLEVHQATGMLAAAHGISAGQAFSRLRAHAFASGQLIDDLARDIVARRIPADEV